MILKPKWEFKVSLSGEKKHELLYRDDELGAQLEIYTPVYGGPYSQRFGEEKWYYFIDNDERVFRTEAELVEALNEAN